MSTTWRVLLAVALSAAPSVLVSSGQVHACSCLPGSFEDRVWEAELIVISSVNNVRFVTPPPRPQPVSPPATPAEIFLPQVNVEWDFAVEEFLSGAGLSEFTIRSYRSVTVAPDGTAQIIPGSDPTCGWSPVDGHRYLFLLRRGSNGIYQTGACATHLEMTPEADADVARIRALLAEGVPTAEALPSTGSGGDASSAPASD